MLAGGPGGRQHRGHDAGTAGTAVLARCAVGFLGPTSPLPRRLERVLVAGVAGAGKTTLAGRIAEVLGVGHVEIDALHHGPGWVPRPQFLDDVRAVAARPGWVTEWQYAAARPILLERAHLLVWLDLPVAQAMAQVTWRTVKRRTMGTELWNGNREPPLRTILHDPEHIVRWAWGTRHTYRQRLPALAEARPDLPVVRLRRHRQADTWLRCSLAAIAAEGT